jgi:hypothetical protein
LYFTGIAPAATDALSNAQNAFISSGASAFIFSIFARLALLYISVFMIAISPAVDRDRGVI